MPKFIITDDNRKFDLEKAQDLGISTREEHGVYIEGVWKTKTGKIIVATYSMWQHGNSGECVGETFHVAGPDEIASLAKEHDNDTLTAMVPVEE